MKGMKKMKKIITITLVLILTAGLMAGCSDTGEQEQISPTGTSIITTETTAEQNPGYGAAGSFENPDVELEQMLVYAVQDEYLARSEYEYLINELDAGNPFANIIKAEEKHISMLLPLFESYGFEAPEDTSAAHIIPVESITAALETGVQAEIDNIAMYEQFLEGELPDDVRAVFVELRDASKNHLAAFERKLSR